MLQTSIGHRIGHYLLPRRRPSAFDRLAIDCRCAEDVDGLLPLLSLDSCKEFVLNELYHVVGLIFPGKLGEKFCELESLQLDL